MDTYFTSKCGYKLYNNTKTRLFKNIVLSEPIICIVIYNNWFVLWNIIIKKINVKSVLK